MLLTELPGFQRTPLIAAAWRFIPQEACIPEGRYVMDDMPQVWAMNLQESIPPGKGNSLLPLDEIPSFVYKVANVHTS